MRNEVALTPATKKLWANRPAEEAYPPRDTENLWETAYQRRQSHMARDERKNKCRTKRRSTARRDLAPRQSARPSTTSAGAQPRNVATMPAGVRSERSLSLKNHCAAVVSLTDAPQQHKR